MLGVPLVLPRWLTQHNGQLLAHSIIDNDWSRWFAISGFHIFAVAVSVFMGVVVVKKKVKN
jgi:hypothetical protein